MTSRFFLRLSLLLVLLTSCAPAAAPSPTPDFSVAYTQAFQTALAALQPTATSLPTDTPVPPPTAVRTPPALPALFVASQLNPVDTPHTYVQDACQYLHDKWNSNNSAPGTIAMIVMFHGIIKGQAETDNQISVQDFAKLMNDLHDLGYEAINTQQLADFLYHNAKVPNRSVLLVQDDRHAAQNFTDHFLPYYQKWGWPVVNGWISAFGGQDNVLAENVNLGNEGWVDYQAHGATSPHVPIDPSWTDEMILHDLQGSMGNIQKYFGKAPIAYIWPGGGFTPHAVQLAHQVRYQLGFTINPRGPLMYNWIPQADAVDPARPVYLPEGPAGDPLMTLPRYWDTDIRSHLDDIRTIGKDAATYAEQNKNTELDYYNIMCAPKLGPIP